MEQTVLIPVEEGPRLEPVQLEVVRQCHFKAKPCKACGLPKSNRVHTPKKTATCKFRAQRGCLRCGLNKGDAAHFGAPMSFNALGSGDPGVYMTLKKNWQDVLTQRLEESKLPRGLERVFAEGDITFPDRADRDQGNFRIVIEKALGDALEQGEWLDSDSWEHYEFGGLTQHYVAGESATRIVLFPQAKSL